MSTANEKKLAKKLQKIDIAGKAVNEKRSFAWQG